MITFIIIIWSILWFAISSLSLIQLFDDSGCRDMDSICFDAFVAILLGLVWPITIWVGMFKWYHDRDKYRNGYNPAWVKALIKLFNMWRGYVRKN